MIEAGRILQGRYRIERQIGAGGMGAVFVATDERFNSTVAIKETLFTDQRLRKAFEREARLLNSLRHHALPRVSDHFVEENGQFLVMEYIPGDDLSEMMLKRRKAFPVADVLDWADQLLDALEFLHTQEMPVIHRDIKPQNLKLTPRGQIILLDFGLAKGNPTDADSPTAAKSVFGYSRNYASLEQIQGTGTDPRSDLYSLAATLYHLMSGLPPADALTRAMAVLNGEKDPLIPPHQISAEIPYGVSEVLVRAMALNASHRPSSAAAMRELLREGANIFEPVNAEDFKTIPDAAFSAGASLFTQNTAVMSDEAKAGGQTETEDETSVRTNLVGAKAGQNIKIPGAAKKETVIQPLTKTTESGEGKKSRFAVAAVVLGSLLAVCGAALGLYAYNPAIFHSTTPDAKVDQKFNLADDAPKTEPANTSAADELLNPSVAVESPNTSNFAANTPSETATTRRETAPKADEKASAETAPKNSKDRKAKQEQPGETSVGEKTPEMAADDVKLKGERIETDEVIIDKGKIYFKKPPGGHGATVGRPLFTREQLRRMTPEQREKLRKAMQLYRQRVPKMEPMPPPYVPAPKPKPTQN